MRTNHEEPKRGIIATVLGVWSKLFDTNQPHSGYATLYSQLGFLVPPDVRSDFQQFKGEITKETFLSLAARECPPELLIYGTMKFLIDDIERQKDFLTDIVAWNQSGKDGSEINALVRKHLEHISPDARIEATKIGFVARIGESNFRDRWKTVLTEARAGEGYTPCLVGNSAFLGLLEMLDQTPDHGQCMLAGVHSRRINTTNIFGFIFQRQGNSFAVTPFDEHSNIRMLRPENENLRVVPVVHTNNPNPKPQLIQTLLKLSLGFFPCVDPVYFNHVPQKTTAPYAKPEVKRPRLFTSLGDFALQGGGWASLYQVATVAPICVRHSTDGYISKKEFLGIGGNEFENLFINLTIRLLDGQAQAQAELMEMYGSIILGADAKFPNSERWQQIRTCGIEALATLPEDTKVKASKIKTVYRMGTDLFAEQWDAVARDVVRRDATPVVMAYAGLHGFSSLVRALSPGRGMLVMDPSGQDDAMAFLVIRREKDISVTAGVLGDLVEKIPDFNGTVSLVDDVIRSGETMDRAEAILKRTCPGVSVCNYFCVSRAPPGELL